MAAIGFFRLGQTTSPLLEEFDQWAHITQSLGGEGLFDLGFAKAKDEVLMCAKPYFHTHGLVNQSVAELQLGTIKHSVHLSQFSKASDQSRRLLEDFMPISIDSRERKKYHGSYNQHWVDNIHPGFPEDTHPLLFNQANSSLQEERKRLFGKSIVPGNDYQLQDVHPVEKKIVGKLPDIRVRMFLNKGEVLDKHGCEFIEIENHLETVWFFPEVNLGAVIYRGVDKVHNSDGLDVKNIMLCYENQQDAPRSIEYYRNIFALRSNHKHSLAHLFNESQLSPEKTPQEVKRIEALIEKANSEKTLSPIEAAGRQQARDIIKASVPENSPEAKQLQQALNSSDKEENDEYHIPTIPEELIASGDFDLSPVIEAATKLGEKLQREMKEKS